MAKKEAGVRSFGSEYKVSIIGCGNVGATAAYTILLEGSPTELVLMDIDKGRAEGLRLDFDHSMSFLENINLKATDKFADCKGSHLIVVTAGARQKDGETRLDLIEKNRKIFQKMIPELAKVAPNSIFLIVSNPVDVLVYEAWKLSGFPRNRVFGSGTMLDTARFRFHIAEKLKLSPKSIDAFVLGEHGDSSFPVLSSANVSGKPLFEFINFDRKMADLCYHETKTAAYRIIHDLGYTCYSISVVIRELMLGIYKHSREVLPLSVVLDDYYGHSDVALSVPCVLDSTGIAEVIKVPLNEEEHDKLANSVRVLKQFQS